MANYFSKLNKRATQVQKAAGTKDVTKKVYKITRAEAVKRAARELKVEKGRRK